MTIGKLRVLLYHDRNDDHGPESWFAQSLELDYFAQGSTRRECIDHFLAGLSATIDHHLHSHGHINYLLQPHTGDSWRDLYTDSPSVVSHRSTRHHGSLSRLPFSGIDFYAW